MLKSPLGYDLEAIPSTLPPHPPNTGGADKSLARPGRKQATLTEDFEFHISYLQSYWKNISTNYIYNKTTIKRNILTIK